MSDSRIRVKFGSAFWVVSVLSLCLLVWFFSIEPRSDSEDSVPTQREVTPKSDSGTKSQRVTQRQPVVANTRDKRGALKLVLNDPDNGKYFKFSPEFARVSVLGVGVSPSLANISKNHLHKLFRTHPAREIHEKFYWKLVRGEVVVLFGGYQLDMTVSASLSVCSVDGLGEKVCLSVNPQLLLSRSTKMSQLTIYHEYQHLLQLERGQLPRSFFRPRTGLMPMNMIGPWLESEYQAHLITAKFAMRQKWKSEHAIYSAFEYAAFTEFKATLFKLEKGHPLHKRAMVAIQKNGPFGLMLVLYTLMTGPEETASWSRKLRARCLLVARVALRKKLGEVYSQFPFLGPEQCKLLIKLSKQPPK